MMTLTRNVMQGVFRRSYVTVSQLLDAATERYPYKDAIRSMDQKIRFSFEDLQQQSHEFASGLLDMNFKTGDALGVYLPNSVENIVTQLAAAKSGVTLVELNHCRTADELRSALSQFQCMGILYEPRMNGLNLTELVQDIAAENKLPLLQYKITTGQYDIPNVHQFRHLFVNALEEYHWEARLKEIGNDTVLRITADGTSITHDGALEHVNATKTELNLSADDSVCITDVQKYIHVALAGWAQNAQVVLPSKEYNEEQLQHALKVERCRVLDAKCV